MFPCSSPRLCASCPHSPCTTLLCLPFSLAHPHPSPHHSAPAQPETAVSSLMHWLTLVKARIADCVEKMKKLAPEALTALLEKSSESLHLHEHPDTCVLPQRCPPPHLSTERIRQGYLLRTSASASLALPSSCVNALSGPRPLLCCPPYPMFPCPRALITPSPIPIVILCTKYDIFQDVERCVSKPAVC